MGKPLREDGKDVRIASTPQPEIKTRHLDQAWSENEPVASPARVLQKKLQKQFSAKSSKLSARYVTWLVLATCAGTWIAGLGLYSAL